jgi:plastocyanin
MRVRFFLAATAGLSIVAGLWACTSDDTTPIPVFDPDASAGHPDATVPDASDAAVDSAGDSAPGTDSGGDTGADGGSGDSGRVVNNCGEAEFAANDFSGPDASRVIRFPRSDGGLGYEPSCMRIAAGESVTWRGDFLMHPLATLNGDQPSPITGPYYDAGPDGGGVTIEFGDAGWFGFECTVHSSMTGAIEVK